MSKVLIFSDSHIHAHKKSLDRLQNCLDALEWVFSTAEDRQITDIVFCGDLFHDRQKIDVLTYQRTFEIIQKHLQHTKKKLRLLLGNHDLFHLAKWDISSVLPFSAIEGVEVISSPCSMTIGGKTFDFLPYTKNPISWLEKFTDRKNNVLCAHLAVDGAQLNVMHNTRMEVSIEHDGDMVKVSPDLFKDWRQVFLGHYHGEQKLLDNVEYVGSPLQLNFGEAFQFKHIIIYDTETGGKEYIRNTFSPQHFIIPAKDIDKYDLNNNFIRVVVDDLAATDIVEMRSKIIKENDVGSLEIQPVEKEKRNHVVENAAEILNDENEMLIRYIDDVGLDGLDRDMLLEIGKLICTSLTDQELAEIS